MIKFWFYNSARKTDEHVLKLSQKQLCSPVLKIFKFGSWQRDSFLFSLGQKKLKHMFEKSLINYHLMLTFKKSYKVASQILIIRHKNDRLPLATHSQMSSSCVVYFDQRLVENFFPQHYAKKLKKEKKARKLRQN